MVLSAGAVHSCGRGERLQLWPGQQSGLESNTTVSSRVQVCGGRRAQPGGADVMVRLSLWVVSSVFGCWSTALMIISFPEGLLAFTSDLPHHHLIIVRASVSSCMVG